MFCVKHFAGVVSYNGESGFCEKNKDELPIAAQEVFSVGTSDLIGEMFGELYKVVGGDNNNNNNNNNGKKKISTTIGSQFKEQLSSLLQKIDTTGPHYIRCLKPNDDAEPNLLIPKRLAEQLRYGGVLEAVRVARSGYPVRLPHEEFYSRYRSLAMSSNVAALDWTIGGGSKEEKQEKCVALLDVVMLESSVDENEVRSRSRSRSSR